MLSAGHSAWQQPARAPGTGEECGQPELLWSGEKTGLKDSALIPMTSSTEDPSNPHSVSYSPQNRFVWLDLQL